MSSVFNKGDTAYLLLNFTINGEPMQEGKYQELEFQINVQGNYRAIKKLLSKGEIFWDGNYTYTDAEGQEQIFAGYIVSLDQEDTFLISQGNAEVQLRVLIDGEVGSSQIEELVIGDALSDEVLK